jgi:hypothetical protein
MPDKYKPLYPFSTHIGPACARQFRTFADLAEKLKTCGSRRVELDLWWPVRWLLGQTSRAITHQSAKGAWDWRHKGATVKV